MREKRDEGQSVLLQTSSETGNYFLADWVFQFTYEITCVGTHQIVLFECATG